MRNRLGIYRTIHSLSKDCREFLWNASSQIGGLCYAPYKDGNNQYNHCQMGGFMAQLFRKALLTYSYDDRQYYFTFSSEICRSEYEQLVFFLNNEEYLAKKEDAFYDDLETEQMKENAEMAERAERKKQLRLKHPVGTKVMASIQGVNRIGVVTHNFKARAEVKLDNGETWLIPYNEFHFTELLALNKVKSISPAL